MQHDLKTHETRLGQDARLVGWCICGGWTYDSPKLHQGPMVSQFIEHLGDVSMGRITFRHNEENAPF